MVDVNFVVGQPYPVSNGVASVNLNFLGMVGTGPRRVLLFDNPTQLGYPFLYIGAIVEIVYPAASAPTITVSARLRARYGGQTQTVLHPLDLGGHLWNPIP